MDFLKGTDVSVAFLNSILLSDPLCSEYVLHGTNLIFIYNPLLHWQVNFTPPKSFSYQPRYDSILGLVTGLCVVTPSGGMGTITGVLGHVWAS